MGEIFFMLFLTVAGVYLTALINSWLKESASSPPPPAPRRARPRRYDLKDAGRDSGGQPPASQVEHEQPLALQTPPQTPSEKDKEG